MSDEQKEKFIQLDEEQGVWLIGKGQKKVPPETPAAPQSETGATAPADPVEIIRAALAESATAASNPNASQAAAVNYATDFPLPPTQAGRRGPGPSLEMFKDMARQVKRTGF